MITANKLQRLKSIFPFRGDAGVKGISAEIETNSKTERNLDVRGLHIAAKRKRTVKQNAMRFALNVIASYNLLSEIDSRSRCEYCISEFLYSSEFIWDD